MIKVRIGTQHSDYFTDQRLTEAGDFYLSKLSPTYERNMVVNLDSQPTIDMFISLAYKIAQHLQESEAKEKSYELYRAYSEEMQRI